MGENIISIRKKLVGLSGVPQGESPGLLFDALARLFPVEFCVVDGRNHELLDALIVLDGNVTTGLAAAARGLPAYVVAARGDAPDAIAGGGVHFGSSASLNACLRHQVMDEREASAGNPLTFQPGDELLASQGGHPVWLNRPAGPGACQIAAFPLPLLRESEFLFQHFNSRRFMPLLTLMNYLQQLTKDVGWQAAPSPACFVFDDPSLYWRSYGFISFRRLAEFAEKHNFFAAVATIPLDTWWVNRGVAATFRAASPRLSLLIHGNNHTTREMLLQPNEAGHLAAAAQAMRRMERLERRHGIKYLKVMEAPHGALANDMFQHLLVLGYEAALCTAELLVRHNPDATWPATFGMHRSEILGGGLPVSPRIRMSSHWRNDVLLKAFLRQPIIIAGHHYDAANGMELLAQIATVVNGLGTVIWSDVQGVLQTNYLQRMEGDQLRVKMYSRRIRIVLPPGVRGLCVERPWLEPGRAEKLLIEPDGGAKMELETGPATDWIALGKAMVVDITSQVANPLASSKVPPPAPSPWPVARKILMEVRDRLSTALPIVGRLCRRSPLGRPEPVAVLNRRPFKPSPR
jgi:hypothetical protein